MLRWVCPMNNATELNESSYSSAWNESKPTWTFWFSASSAKK